MCYAMVNLGVSLATQGQHNEALERYKQAAEIAGDDAALFFNWGTGLMQLGKLIEASEMFEKAVKFSPADPQAHYNLAICLRRLGRNEETAEHLKIFVEMARTRFPQQVQRARELLELMEQDRL